MYKQKLQELCQKNKWELPTYSTTKYGLDHNPSFTSSITVNGFSFSSSSTSSSSRKSQNNVAHIAFLHFTSASPNPEIELSDPIHQEPRTNSNDDDMQSIYKQQLQDYADWKIIDGPVYTSTTEGPPDAPPYRATVVIEGRAFETSESFGTSNEAENACALMALSSIGADDFDEGNTGFFYKNLLMELSQKENIPKPVYETISIGAPHAPTFYLFVEFYGDKFFGKAGKSKKAAESNTAKVAFTYLEAKWIAPLTDVISIADGRTAGDCSTYYENALTEIQNGICDIDITNEENSITNNKWVSVDV